MPSYIVTLANAAIIFKVGLQALTAQSAMETELVGAALAMKEEAVFCSSMILELDFDKNFGSVPLYINNTSALHIAGNRTLHSSHKAYRAVVLLFRARTGGG